MRGNSGLHRRRGLTLFLQWWYATRVAHLPRENLSSRLITAADRRILPAPLIAAISIAVSFVDVRVSLVLYGSILVTYLLPAAVDKHL